MKKKQRTEEKRRGSVIPPERGRDIVPYRKGTSVSQCNQLKPQERKVQLTYTGTVHHPNKNAQEKIRVQQNSRRQRLRHKAVLTKVNAAVPGTVHRVMTCARWRISNEGRAWAVVQLKTSTTNATTTTNLLAGAIFEFSAGAIASNPNRSTQKDECK